MPTHVAIFADKSQHYAADTCEPLAAAQARGDVRLEALVRGAYPGRRLPVGMLPRICSVGYWDALQSQQWGLDWHRNEGLELTFLERGSLSFAVGNEVFDLKPGALTVTRPWQPHRVGNPNVGASRLHWLIIDLGVRRPNQPWRWPSWIMLAPDDLNALTTSLRQNEQPVWPADQEMRQCWQRIARAIESGEMSPSHSRLRVQINSLLLLLAEAFARHKPPLDPSLTGTERTIELFLEELRQNEGQRRHPWTIQQMAESCGLGVTQFVSVCRQLTNRTPAKYLLQCRMESARELLLREPDRSVTDIALACGFSSGQYFTTLFRHEVGATPTAFRSRRTAA